MKPNVSSKSTTCRWDFIGAGASRDQVTIVPSLTMKSSEFWPVVAEVKPYAGPTLWTPRNSGSRTKQPFLTLTPSHNPKNRAAISLVSLTPQQNNNEMKPISQLASSDSRTSCNADANYMNSVQSSSSVSLPSIFQHDEYTQLPVKSSTNQKTIRRKKKTQSPIFPDVFSLGASKSKKRSGKSVHRDFIQISPRRTRNNVQEQAISGTGDHWICADSETLQSGLAPMSLSDHNEQDKGTLFSRQHRVMYSHMARDPTFLPLLHNEAVDHQGGLASDYKPTELSSYSNPSHVITIEDSQIKGPNFSTRLAKHQIRARKDYIKAHAHFSIRKSSEALGCVGNQATPRNVSNEPEPDLVLDHVTTVSHSKPQRGSDHTKHSTCNSDSTSRRSRNKPEMELAVDYYKNTLIKQEPMLDRGRRHTFRNQNPDIDNTTRFSINPNSVLGDITTHTPKGVGLVLDSTAKHSTKSRKPETELFHSRNVQSKLQPSIDYSTSKSNSMTTDKNQTSRHSYNGTYLDHNSKSSPSKLEMGYMCKDSTRNRSDRSHRTVDSDGTLKPSQPSGFKLKPLEDSPLHSTSAHRDDDRLRGQVVAAEFCDVLGQNTCHRCREFYHKNFTQPAKEKTERRRSPGPPPPARENTMVVPTVGLQKVVIKVKDERGKTAVTLVGVNPGFV